MINGTNNDCCFSRVIVKAKPLSLDTWRNKGVVKRQKPTCAAVTVFALDL